MKEFFLELYCKARKSSNIPPNIPALLIDISLLFSLPPFFVGFIQFSCLLNCWFLCVSFGPCFTCMWPPKKKSGNMYKIYIKNKHYLCSTRCRCRRRAFVAAIEELTCFTCSPVSPFHRFTFFTWPWAFPVLVLSFTCLYRWRACRRKSRESRWR